MRELRNAYRILVVNTKKRKHWRKLHKQELHDCAAHNILSGDQVEKNEMGGHEGNKQCIQDFGGKHQEK
jgi:hypothetical protein